jgi:hypothetical protein
LRIRKLLMLSVLRNRGGKLEWACGHAAPCDKAYEPSPWRLQNDRETSMDEHAGKCRVQATVVSHMPGYRATPRYVTGSMVNDGGMRE